MYIVFGLKIKNIIGCIRIDYQQLSELIIVLRNIFQNWVSRSRIVNSSILHVISMNRFIFVTSDK